MATLAGPPIVVARAAPRPRKREIQVTPWPAIILILTTLLPSEVRFTVGGLIFYAGRIGLLITFPWIVMKVIQGAIRLVLPDWLVIFSGLWMFISVTVIYGMDRGFQSGGVQAFDLFSSYFLARITFRSMNAVARVFTFVAPFFLLAGISLMVESLSHKLWVRPFAISIFGRLPIFEGTTGGDLAPDFRMGLLRAYGPFPNPILGGLYMSSLISLYTLTSVRKGTRAIGILSGFFSLFTLSSAAYAGIILHVSLLAYEYIQRVVSILTWKLFLNTLFILMFLVQIFSNGGLISIIVRYMSFDPFTGYYRMLIWQYGGATALANPWFGIGMAEYDRPEWMFSPSIDAHWLLVAIRYGLPTVISLGLAVILTIVALTQSGSRAGPQDGPFYRGVAITLSIFVIQMFSVSLWGSVLMWFYLLLGLGVSTAQRQLSAYRVSIHR